MKLFGKKIIILNKEEHAEVKEALSTAQDVVVSAVAQAALQRLVRLLGAK